MIRRLLLICTILLALPATTQASTPVRTSGTTGVLPKTDEQLLAANLDAASAAFPAANCTTRTVHLHAVAQLIAWFPGEIVAGYTRGCEIWMKSDLGPFFRLTLFHEMAHTAGWEHSEAMDRAVARALGPVSRTSSKKHHRRHRSHRRPRNFSSLTVG